MSKYCFIWKNPTLASPPGANCSTHNSKTYLEKAFTSISIDIEGQIVNWNYLLNCLGLLQNASSNGFKSLPKVDQASLCKIDQEFFV